MSKYIGVHGFCYIKLAKKFPALFAFVLLVDQIVFFQFYSTPILMHCSTLSLRWSVFLF